MLSSTLCVLIRCCCPVDPTPSTAAFVKFLASFSNQFCLCWFWLVGPLKWLPTQCTVRPTEFYWSWWMVCSNLGSWSQLSWSNPFWTSLTVGTEFYQHLHHSLPRHQCSSSFNRCELTYHQGQQPCQGFSHSVEASMQALVTVTLRLMECKNHACTLE